MKITVDKTGVFLNKLINKLLDPVLLYTVLVMTAIMYHFRDVMAFRYFIRSLILCFLLFRLFDFIDKHRIFGAMSYIGVWVMNFYAVSYCIAQGRRGYPIGFYLWFFTPQLAMDFNPWYTFVIFLLFGVFMSSVIYYFTKIRYRLFMNFLILMIPFVIFGKEYEKMPTAYIILLAVGFIVIMIYSRQLQQDGNTVIVDRKPIISTAAVFTVIFAVIASVIPKPYVVADRRAIETLVSAESFTDRLVEKLSGFRDTSSGGQYRNVNRDTILYLAAADAPVRLKTATFSSYDPASDSWSTSDADSVYDEIFDSTPADLAETGALTKAILTAAKYDSDFAQKYGLTDYVSAKLYQPQKHTIRLYSVFQENKSAPVPGLAERLTATTYPDEFAVTSTGVLFSRNGKFRRTDEFAFDYSQDTFFAAAVNKEIVDSLSTEEYKQLLSDAVDVTYDASDDHDDADDAFYVLSDELYYYKHYAKSMLKYNDSQRIAKLAEEITSGLTTDYDKAKAIESYFFKNGYIYDLSYVKTAGENVENFLFNTKRGVCYEYATAMVLLSRAAGIPARYCEGFNMSRQYDNKDRGTNYMISTLDGHGYPELYIRGFGWLSFEPTVSDNVVAAEERSADKRLAIAGVIILAAALLILLCVKLYPIAVHKLFLCLSRKRSPEKVTVTAMKRIRRLYGIGAPFTSDEAAERVREVSGADISGTAAIFDKAVFGQLDISEQEKDRVIAEYTKSFAALQEAKKRKNGSKRLKKA